MLDGVIIDNEIEGVDEEQTVASPPVASDERGGYGRWSAVTVCMFSHGGGDLNKVVGSRMHMFPMMTNCSAFGAR